MSRRHALGVVALVLATGCFGELAKEAPRKHRYVLEVVRPAADGAPQGDDVARVEFVRVSPLFERKGLVYRTGETTYESDFYHEFFAPPGVLVRRAIVDWLEASPLFASAAPPPDVAADWLLEVSVTELYGDLRDPAAPQARLALDAQLRDARSPDLRVVYHERFRAAEPVPGAQPRALVASWGTALSRVLADLEAGIARRISSAPRPTEGS